MSEDCNNSSLNPRLVLVFSGKRKSGKDFVTDILKERLGDKCVIIRLSGPLKECYAKDNGLDYEKLLSASDYKEKYRVDMLRWSEAIRNQDYTYFCKAAISKYEATKYPIWIISDARRLTDHTYFRENYAERMKTVRILASDDVRKTRGWEFTEGVDDKETECGLDSVTDWDYRIENNGDLTGEELTLPLVQLANNL
jgi:phosphomevalonate kinase